MVNGLMDFIGGSPRIHEELEMTGYRLQAQGGSPLRRYAGGPFLSRCARLVCVFFPFRHETGELSWC